LGNRIEGGGASELKIEGVSGNRSRGLLEELANVLGLVEVALFDIARATVHPGGLDQVVVAMTADGLADNGCPYHLLGNMMAICSDVKGNATRRCGGAQLGNSQF